MKKLNTSEVSNVIGGYVFGCVSSFERQTVGTQSVCRRVVTCQGKFGEYVNREPADLASCPAA